VIPIGSYQREFGVTLSLPSVVGRGGVTMTLPPDLSAEEKSGCLQDFHAYLKSEDKPDCGIDCVAIEVAISQSIIDLREHKPGVSLKLRGKSPIDGE
jgi:hypothetical protein